MRLYRFAPDRFEQEGWRGQFARMQRWHRRALDALDRHPGDAEDFIYAFCQAAYHLRDWLQKSSAARQPDLDALMNGAPALKLCRDVCNGSKHLTLDPERTNTDHIGLMREYVPPIGANGTGRSRPRLFVFEDQDGTIEMVDIQDLMSECVEAWTNFCAGLPGQFSDT
jgi:hypothetical protein